MMKERQTLRITQVWPSLVWYRECSCILQSTARQTTGGYPSPTTQTQPKLQPQPLVYRSGLNTTVLMSRLMEDAQPWSARNAPVGWEGPVWRLQSDSEEGQQLATIGYSDEVSKGMGQEGNLE